MRERHRDVMRRGASRRVVEDESEGAPAPGSDGAHAVPGRAVGPSAGRADGVLPGGEHDGVPPIERHRRRSRLGTRALADDDELTPGVVETGPVETDHHL